MCRRVKGVNFIMGVVICESLFCWDLVDLEVGGLMFGWFFRR